MCVLGRLTPNTVTVMTSLQSQKRLTRVTYMRGGAAAAAATLSVTTSCVKSPAAGGHSTWCYLRCSCSSRQAVCHQLPEAGWQSSWVCYCGNAAASAARVLVTNHCMKLPAAEARSFRAQAWSRQRSRQAVCNQLRGTP